jgi:hypothetical protein
MKQICILGFCSPFFEEMMMLLNITRFLGLWALSAVIKIDNDLAESRVRGRGPYKRSPSLGTSTAH